MSYHSSFDWNFDKRITNELIDELVRGLKSNKKHNRNGTFMGGCYSILSSMDQLMFNTGRFLDKGDYSKSAIEIYAIKVPNIEKFKIILRRVSARFKEKK